MRTGVFQRHFRGSKLRFSFRAEYSFKICRRHHRKTVIMYPQRVWPIFVNDKEGRRIYLTKERWEHALGHPGMNNSLLPYVVNTLQLGIRSQDRYDPNKYKYGREYSDLPMLYTHMIVVVKFGWKGIPAQANNIILTAYMVEKW